MKTIIVYYSSTGNTLELANKLNKNIKDSILEEVTNVEAVDCLEYDNIVLGCPAMGAEELASEFVDFNEQLKNLVGNQKIFLFGSYGWGDGEWMRNWENDYPNNFKKSIIYNEGLINIDENELNEFIKLINA